MERVQLIFQSSEDVLKAYIPKTLFDAVCQRARSEGMPYRRFIRQIIESEAAARERHKRKGKTRAKR